MFVEETKHRDAGKFAWFAARDASMKHAVNASLFTDSQKILAERVKIACEMVYSCAQVVITNCKKWIRVKVVKTNGVLDKKALKTLENDWTNLGITKTVTNQGVIYHVV